MKKVKKEKHDILPISLSLVKKKHETIMQLYLQFLCHVKDIKDNMNIGNLAKVKELNEIESVFDNDAQYNKDKLKFIVKLKKNFVSELLAPSLFRDIINSAKKDSSEFEYKTWGQLVNYCTTSSGTVGRFLLALNDESPSTYIPTASLFAAYHMLYKIKNIRYDVNILKRVYIPEDLLIKHGVNIKDLYQYKYSKELKNLIKDMLKEIKKMLKDAEIIPSIIKDLRLRMQLCMILSSANILFRKVKNADVLAKNVKLTKFDFLNSYITGIIEGTFTSYKDVNAKRLNK